MSKSLMSRMRLGDKITAAIAPEAWEAYQTSVPKGTITNMDGWKLIDALAAAGRVMDMLHAEGFPVPARRKKQKGTTT